MSMQYSLRTAIGAIIGAACLAGAAGAQTVTDAFDANNIVVPYGTNTANDFSAPVTFTVTAPGESLYIQGTALSSPYISGIGSLVDLTTNSVVFENASLTNLAVGNPLFSTASLAAGTYQFLYSFSDISAALPNTVSIQATLTSPVRAPEVDPSQAAAGLTLLAGGLMVLRGRRRSVSSVVASAA
jgi:hypothetical protein